MLPVTLVEPGLLLSFLEAAALAGTSFIFTFRPCLCNTADVESRVFNSAETNSEGGGSDSRFYLKWKISVKFRDFQRSIGCTERERILQSGNKSSMETLVHKHALKEYEEINGRN